MPPQLIEQLKSNKKLDCGIFNMYYDIIAVDLLEYFKDYAMIEKYLDKTIVKKNGWFIKGISIVSHQI